MSNITIDGVEGTILPGPRPRGPTLMGKAGWVPPPVCPLCRFDVLSSHPAERQIVNGTMVWVHTPCLAYKRKKRLTQKENT